MGQSLSRRGTTPGPVSESTTASAPRQPNDTHSTRRSLPRRILSSIPKPSLRSHPLSSSLALPTRPEQTLRGKNRRWRLSRGHNVPANTAGAVLERMGPLTEHDEQVDRDVDEFGVITHRVPDNHSDSPAASAKGKEKAKEIPDTEHDDEDDDESPIPSTSTLPPLAESGTARNSVCDDQVIIAPTDSPPPPLPPVHEPERLSVPLPSIPTPPSPPQPSTQQQITNPRPFPPPGTLVVVQGVVHTTDVTRPSDRPATIANPIALTTNDASTNTNFDPSSTRPSSVPPETRPRNRLSGILPRPSSMVPTVPSPEPTIGPSNIDSQARQTLSNSGAAEDSEDDDRAHTHPHGFSMTQGPVGASGLSASSVDVLGTLLSVAAAATAASLLTGSSEPIFSSGLTSSQPPPPSNFVPHPTAFSPNVPSERPLSPTPTSDAGRMRHVWSSLRDRLGLGSGAHSSNHSNDPTPSLGPGQAALPQPLDVGRPRDPREIMLAEMARAFNLGLGLGGTTASVPPASANPNITDLAISEDRDALAGDREGEQSSLPPPDSFERFLMDLQSDLRVTLMREQEPGGPGEAARDTEEVGEDAEDQPIPELQSLSDSDSDSEESGIRHFESDGEDPLSDVDNVDNEGDEDVHAAQEQLNGRTSPAVSATGTGTHHPSFGLPLFGASGVSPPRTMLSQSTSTAISFGADGETGTNSTTDNARCGGVGLSSSVSAETGGRISTNSSSPPEREEESESQREGAVSGVVHSREASNGGRSVEAEGCRAISGPIAVPPLDVQDPSNISATATGQEAFLLGTSSSGPSTSNIPSSFPTGSVPTPQLPTQPPTSTLPLPSDPETTTRTLSATNPIPAESSMPFRLPFTPSSASRTEHTPGGGINWWRMYRFPAIASPNPGQQGEQGSSPAVRIPAQGSGHSSTSPWTRTTDQNQRNETITSREVAQIPAAHSGLVQAASTPRSTASAPHMPEIVSAPSQSTGIPAPTNGQDSNPPTSTSPSPPEHRSNVVVPVIVVGLQSVNMDRQPPHVPHPHANHIPATDDEYGEGMEFDGLDNPMSMPLHIPEPPEFRHLSSPLNTTQQEQSGQQPSRGRTWQSRAANAFRNLRPSRRNADAASPQPQETPGSRTFLIYVIGGYYPPDHQIITGGNLDSFEALWELAELLGQVKPPTVSKEEIEKSGLEIIKASVLGEYEKQGHVASNCVDRCLICLDDYNPEDDLRVLTCKHTFHQGCVDRWLETGRNNCPACRTKGVGGENASSTSAASSDAIA